MSRLRSVFVVGAAVISAALTVFVAGEPVAVAVPAGWTQLQNFNSGMCLQPSGASVNEGVSMVQEPCNANVLAQFWRGVPVSSTSTAVKFQNYATYVAGHTYCLEVYNSSLANGATVDQWNCNGTATQSWQRPGSWALQNLNSGKGLEVYHSSTSAGARVDQWTLNGTLTQDWN